MIFLAKQAASSQKLFLKSLQADPVIHIQFDDLITIEHTKMKPLTISIAVDVDSRAILGAEVAQIPAFGRLAENSRRKYGHKKSFHREALERLFSKIQFSIKQTSLLESDEHSLYPGFIQKYFPKGTHSRHKGGL